LKIFARLAILLQTDSKKPKIARKKGTTKDHFRKYPMAEQLLDAKQIIFKIFDKNIQFRTMPHQSSIA
jgi:hypothetical protein